MGNPQFSKKENFFGIDKVGTGFNNNADNPLRRIFVEFLCLGKRGRGRIFFFSGFKEGDQIGIGSFENFLDKPATILRRIEGKGPSFNNNFDFVEGVAGKKKAKQAILGLKKRVEIVSLGTHNCWLVTKITFGE